MHRVVGRSGNAPKERGDQGSSLYKSDSERSRTRVRGDNPSELAPVDKGNAGDFHKPHQKAGGNLSIVRFGNGQPKRPALPGALLREFDEPVEEPLGRTNLFEGMDLPIGEPEEWLDLHERSQEALGPADTASPFQVFEGVDGEVGLHLAGKITTESDDILKGRP